MEIALTPEEQAILIEELAQFELDPYGFALWAFPWGEPGSGLEDEQLEEWQKEYLIELGEKLRAGVLNKDDNYGIIPPILMERSTGHGVGKSALVGILTWWAMSTMPNTKGVVTANTETQLRTKTWPEIAKWHRMFIARELFEITATAIFPKDLETRRTWRIDIVPWSEHNPEAFAGLHNMHRRILLIMDEASTIPEIIWETAQGALTDANTQIIWAAFGNPTSNIGRFRENAPDGKFGKRWNFVALDSRTVRRTNKQQIADWLEDYGEDSDYFRVRVRGMFPRTDATAFISFELAKAAAARPLPEENSYQVVLGVDVARQGDDLSIIYPRRGRDARSIPPRVFLGLNTMELAREVIKAATELNATRVFVDGTGIGAGVVDRLLETRMGLEIIEVHFGSKPQGLVDENVYNHRTELYQAIKEWLPRGCIPEFIPKLPRTLIEELTAPTYAFGNKGEIQLEAKRDLKKRLKYSPDAADALALTFALPDLPPLLDQFGRRVSVEVQQVAPDYDPMESI